MDRDEERRRDDVAIDKHKSHRRPHAGGGGRGHTFKSDTAQFYNQSYTRVDKFIMAHSAVIAFDLYSTLLSTESISKQLTKIIRSQEKGTQIAAS